MLGSLLPSEMKKDWKKSWLWKTVRLLAIAYGTLALFACTLADRMLFIPPPPSYSLSDEGLVQFGTDKEFAGFYFPAEKEEAPILLWAHGNGEDAGQVLPVALQLNQMGLGLMVYEYAGYGLSEGKPSEPGTYRSADRAFEFLVQEKKKKPEQIILIGQSVGSGPSTYLAEKEKAAGLVLISPFKSAFRVVTKVKLLPWDRFDNFKRMKNVELPLLVVHGDADEVVPFSHGQALFARHQGEKKFVRLEGVGHNNLWAQSADEVFAEIVAFADQVDK